MMGDTAKRNVKPWVQMHREHRRALSFEALVGGYHNLTGADAFRSPSTSDLLGLPPDRLRRRDGREALGDGVAGRRLESLQRRERLRKGQARRIGYEKKN